MKYKGKLKIEYPKAGDIIKDVEGAHNFRVKAISKDEFEQGDLVTCSNRKGIHVFLGIGGKVGLSDNICNAPLLKPVYTEKLKSYNGKMFEEYWARDARYHIEDVMETAQNTIDSAKEILGE